MDVCFLQPILISAHWCCLHAAARVSRKLSPEVCALNTRAQSRQIRTSIQSAGVLAGEQGANDTSIACAGISAAEYLGALRQVQLEMSLDQQCRQQYGQNAEFDGVDSCRCKQGFINDNGRCVPDTYGIGHQQQASCGYMEAGSVVELSDATFLQMLQEGGMWVVMFYAPWCTHCSQSKPAFEQAAIEYAQAAAMADYHRAQQGLPPGGYQEVQFAMIDGDHYSNIVKHEGIRGFPTIRMYAQGRMVKDYKGDRSVEDLLSFAAGLPQGAHHEAEGLDAQCKVRTYPRTPRPQHPPPPRRRSVPSVRPDGVTACAALDRWRTVRARSSTARCATAARASKTSTASVSRSSSLSARSTLHHPTLPRPSLVYARGVLLSVTPAAWPRPLRADCLGLCRRARRQSTGATTRRPCTRARAGRRR